MRENSPDFLQAGRLRTQLVVVGLPRERRRLGNTGKTGGNVVTNESLFSKMLKLRLTLACVTMSLLRSKDLIKSLLDQKASEAHRRLREVTGPGRSQEEEGEGTAGKT